jgi:hypothetical protein
MLGDVGLELGEIVGQPRRQVQDRLLALVELNARRQALADRLHQGDTSVKHWNPS